jgi:predicted DsbA family dithiol-disulfide isomerase
MAKEKIKVEYFSDILCIWAYIAQIRIDTLKKQYSEDIDIEYRFMPLFGSAINKIEKIWEPKGGFTGYNDHIKTICKEFDHFEIHPEVWLKVRPKTSASCHYVIKSLQLIEKQGVISPESQEKFNGRSVTEEVIWRFREAFFKELLDISSRDCQFNILEELEIPVDAVIDNLKKGDAISKLFDDFSQKENYNIIGSPSLVMNSGRQILYGNVGYRLIESNIHELLNSDSQLKCASWC